MMMNPFLLMAQQFSGAASTASHGINPAALMMSSFGLQQAQGPLN